LNILNGFPIKKEAATTRFNDMVAAASLFLRPAYVSAEAGYPLAGDAVDDTLGVLNQLVSLF
jgi:hypothetical protein